MKTEVFKYSRPARTPPSTFLFLHLHLSNSLDPKTRSHINERFSQPHSTTNDNRQLSAVYSLISVRNFAGHKNLRWPRGQCSAALSGCLIGPPDRRCQRLLSTNRRIESGILPTPRSPCFSGVRAVLEPYSCDDFTVSYAIKHRMPVGPAGVFRPRKWRSSMNSSNSRLFLTAWKYREIIAS
jgi:hypothetical protein